MIHTGCGENKATRGSLALNSAWELFLNLF